MNWLVTGGCGFIGVNFIKFLKGRGDYIRVLDNLSVGGREDLKAVTEYSEITAGGVTEPGLVDLMVGDITDSESAGEAHKSIDALVHMAAHTGVMPSI